MRRPARCARVCAAVSSPNRHRSRRDQDRARAPPRRLHRDAPPQSVLRRRVEGDAGAAGIGQRRARRHSAIRLRRRRRSAAYCKEVGLPIIGCCCPACGDLSLQRQRVKRLIMDLEVEHAGVKQSMLKALGNVMPRHLLDTRLNPSGELRDSVAARLEDEARPDSDPALRAGPASHVGTRARRRPRRRRSVRVSWC